MPGSAAANTAVRVPLPAQEQYLIRPGGNRTPLYRFCKRTIDIVGSFALLLVLSPILLATFLVLTITTRGRPLFIQERVGFCGQRFRIFKFRTMVLDAESKKKLVVNEQDGPIFKNFADPRVTRIGRFLRSTSIDETPQLINVLLGQMSLVGPRPHLIHEVFAYEPWHRQRLSIKPGLTGLWQVAGRSELGFEAGIQLDVWYVQNQGLLTDLQLLFRTPWSVLIQRGAY
jgi:lipopolysaccharide/colanic/teichoic acid biosynthesis glycosyltransferase